MNLFLHELKTYGKSTGIWVLSLSLLIILFLSFFPIYAENAEVVKTLLQGFPQGFLAAFGVDLQTIFSFLGFYGYIFSYIMLCGAIQAMNLGISVISKETSHHTADFLLTKPISRSSVLSAKIVAVITLLLLTNIIYILVASISALIISTSAFQYTTFLLVSLTLIFVQLLFSALGILIAILAPRIKSVLMVSMGTVSGFFMLSMLVSVLRDEKLRYFSPFDYFNVQSIIQYSTYESTFLLLEIILITLMITGSYLLFSKKDIHSA